MTVVVMVIAIALALLPGLYGLWLAQDPSWTGVPR